MSYKLRNINKLTINKQMALPLKFKSIKIGNFLISKCNIEAVKLIENFEFWQKKKPTLFQEQLLMVLNVCKLIKFNSKTEN